MPSSQIKSYSKSAEEINHIFDEIAPKYDFLNKLLSFKQDKLWRKKAVQLSVNENVSSILDVGTGSGVFLEDFVNQHSFKKAIGIDFSEQMLKQAKKRLGERASFERVEIPNLPYEKESFDLVSCAFVLRSISDLDLYFQESFRVLKPGGKLVVLELTRPTAWWMKLLYFPYLNIYLPLIGALFSGSSKAYRFLSTSIQKFYNISQVTSKLKQSGFSDVKPHSLTFGICNLIIAEKKL